jgi:hypothetical protein
MNYNTALRRPHNSMALTRSQLLKLARSGAVSRLAELRSEIDALYKSFPELRRGRQPGAAPGSGKRLPGRRGWNAAQRKAAAERMRKYWAARKSAKKK